MKRQPKKSTLQNLDTKMQLLMKRRLQAYTANMSHAVIEQIDNMIDETQLEIYDETQLAAFRASGDEDGEDFIV